MATHFIALMRRPRRSDGRAVPVRIDLLASGGWTCAIAARIASVTLVLFWSVSAGLVALAADLTLSIAVNARLHRVVKHRVARGALDLSAPTMTQRWLSSRHAKAAMKCDARAEKYLARAATANDDFTVWDLHKKADRNRIWAARCRGLTVD